MNDELWLKMSNNLRMRDRIVKVLQDGSQMLLGYYGNKFNHKTAQGKRNINQLKLLNRF